MDGTECGSRQRHLGFGDRARNPEVGHLHASVAREQDVPWLDVAMDDPARMRGRQGSRDLGRDASRLPRRQGAGPAYDGREVFAVDELHDDERTGLVLAVVKHRHDVRVVEGSGGLGLVSEPFAEVGVAPVLGPQELDRDVPPKLRIVGPIDRGHATLAEQLDQAVAPAQDASNLRQTCSSRCLEAIRLRAGGPTPPATPRPES